MARMGGDLRLREDEHGRAAAGAAGVVGEAGLKRRVQLGGGGVSVRVGAEQPHANLVPGDGRIPLCAGGGLDAPLGHGEEAGQQRPKRRAEARLQPTGREAQPCARGGRRWRE